MFQDHDPTPAPVELKSISLGRDTLTLAVGQTLQLDLKINPTEYGLSHILLTASDTTVIAVTNGGKITARKAGFSVIKATNDKQTISVTCLVTVVPKTVIDSLKVGLLAYFPFNNIGSDSSGKGNNGMLYNISSVPNRFGTANSAYYFNGDNSYIKIKDNSALRLANTDFTLTAWVKLNSYNPSYGANILSKHLSGANNGWAWGINGLAANTGTITFGPGGGSASAISTSTVSVNQWHMVTTAYKIATNQISIYLDGVLNNTVSGLPSPSGAVDAGLYIGRDNPEVPTNGYFVQGAIDDVRIYNRSLTAKEIEKLFNLNY